MGGACFCRAVSLSHDGGITWVGASYPGQYDPKMTPDPVGDPVTRPAVGFDPGLGPDPFLQGSLISGKKAVWYFGAKNQYARQDFTARKSVDNGQSWAGSYELSWAAGSGYSAMAVLDTDGDEIGVLWESDPTGTISWARLGMTAPGHGWG
jgi:hypothetical protein